MITAEQVKQLRDKTGVSVMQCKKALEEANGDMETALLVLKKKSTEVAEKKADRSAIDGLVSLKSDDSRAVIVVLNCETDFVAKSDDFIKLSNDLAEKAWAEGSEKTTAEAPDMISPVVQKTGENIQLGKIEEVSGGVIGTYVHNGKMAVVIKLEGGSKELARDIAMHSAAMKPEFISRENIAEDIKGKMTELFKKEVDESDRPEEIKAKMLAGKLDTYFKERTLLDQPFVKNPDTTIGAMLGTAKVVDLKIFTLA